MRLDPKGGTMRLLIGMVGVVAMLAFASTAGARTTVQSDVDDQAWLDARGMTTEAYLETEPVAAKLPKRCWHAKLFAAIRGLHNKRLAWAWSKGIVCSLNGRIDEFHLRHDRGQARWWEDGPYPSLASYRRFGNRHVFSSYETDFEMGYANWGVTLNMHQYWSKRVDRKVAWHHYGSS